MWSGIIPNLHPLDSKARSKSARSSQRRAHSQQPSVCQDTAADEYRPSIALREGRHVHVVAGAITVPLYMDRPAERTQAIWVTCNGKKYFNKRFN